MTLIDQRILIDAPPQVIWDYVSDPARLAHWHAGYASISVLTTQPTGLGTRRRCTPAGGGKDVIEEITAWIDGLGYEYTIIEGGPYHSFRARLRLQPVPDGTTVQWAVWYRPRGPLGLLRDLFGGRKQLMRMMASSLRELRRQVNQLGLTMDDAYRARVGIQQRLNATERQQYQRRHAAPTGAEPLAPVANSPEAAVSESPSDGSVMPPPAVVETPTADPVSDPAPLPDTEPRPPEGLREAVADTSAPVYPIPASQRSREMPSPFAPPTGEDAPWPPPPATITPPEPLPPVAVEATAPDGEDEPDYRRPTPPHGIPSVRSSREAAAPSPPPQAAPPDTDAVPARRTPPHGISSLPPRPNAKQERDRTPLPAPTPKTDTGEISIWEVFGLRRPSEEDADALEGLIQSVEARRTREQRRIIARQGIKYTVRVRRWSGATGLRLRLALRRMRVRQRRLFGAE